MNIILAPQTTENCSKASDRAGNRKWDELKVCKGDYILSSEEWG